MPPPLSVICTANDSPAESSEYVCESTTLKEPPPLLTMPPLAAVSVSVVPSPQVTTAVYVSMFGSGLSSLKVASVPPVGCHCTPPVGGEKFVRLRVLGGIVPRKKITHGVSSKRSR